MNAAQGDSVIIVLGAIIALIPIWKLIEGHFDKKHAKELRTQNDLNDLHIKSIQATQELNTTMKMLSKDISRLSDDFKDMKDVQTNLFNDLLQLEDEVLKNKNDIETIKNTVFKKDYI